MRINIFVLPLILLCFFMLSLSADAQGISAKGAVLIEADGNEVIFEQHKDLKLPMASTTKIMTALVVLENCQCDQEVLIEPHMTGIEGSSIYLQAGEILTVSDLLHALMLESANDAAVALAFTVGGSIEGFATLMNEKACSLGLTSTHFTNPHGLDDDEHYTTAYELALITKEALKNPTFAEIVSTYKHCIPLNNGEGTRVLVNHNKLLRSYDGAVGVKTGYTKRCGRCLVSYAKRNGVSLICVTLGDPNDWHDHKVLLDRGFDEYESVTLAEENSYKISLNVVNSEKNTFIARNASPLHVTLKKGEKNSINAVTEIKRMYFAPVKKGDFVGRIVFYNNDKEIGIVPLYATENVSNIKYKKSIFERLFG